MPSPSYNRGSYADRNASNTYGYAYQGNSYGTPTTRMGIGGAPAEGDDHGRGVGQTIGTGIGKVFGAIFKPVNYVMNGGVNVLRGVEDSTGMRGLGVGYQQNPGYRFGERQPNIQFSGSYNMQNSSGYGYQGGEARDTRPGLWGNRDKPVRQYMSSNGGDVNINGEPRTAGNSGFFTAGSSLFGDKKPSLSGAKNSIFVKDEATSAFISGYNFTVEEARGLEKLDKAINDEAKIYQDANGTTDGFVPSKQLRDLAEKAEKYAPVRQELGSVVFEATMKHAAHNPDDYYGKEYAAGQEYLREIGQSSASYHVTNIQDKSTIDKLQFAYGTAAKTNQGVEDLTKIIKSSKSESELVSKLDNFNNPARAATVKTLDSTQLQAHEHLSSQKFTDPNAKMVQNALLSNPAVWKDDKGIATDTEAQRFVLVPRNGGFALKLRDGDNEPVYVAIPANKIEQTFALVAKQSIEDKKKDIKFEDSAKEITALVKTYGTPDAVIFNGRVGESVDLLAMAEKEAIEAKKAAEEAKKAAEEEAKKQGTDAREKASAIAKATEEAIREKPEVEKQIATVTAERNAANTAKITAQSTFDVAQSAVDTSEAKLALAKESANQPWYKTTGISVISLGAMAAPTLYNKAEVQIAAAEKDLAAKKEEAAKAETALKTATDKYSLAEGKLGELVGKHTQLEAQINGSEQQIAEANNAAEAATQKLAELTKKVETEQAQAAKGNPEAFADKVVAQLKTIGLDKPADIAEARASALEAANNIAATDDPSKQSEIIKDMISQLRSKAHAAGKEAAGDYGVKIAENRIQGILPALRQTASEDLKLAPEQVSLIAQNEVPANSVNPLHIQNAAEQIRTV